jgi:hypothetical protein
MPVGFPPKPPSPIPFYRVPKTPGKSKTDPVAGQVVLQYKKFCAPASSGTTTKPLAPGKNFPNFVPSL